MEVVYILPYNVSDIFQLSKFMPIMFREHTLWANYGVANFAEVLYLFVLMLVTVNFPVAFTDGCRFLLSIGLILELKLLELLELSGLLRVLNSWYFLPVFL